jgi:sugar O-acyltransferase (sialic acid O-acetyltransferase NeuD family)
MQLSQPLLILGTTPYALVFADAFSDVHEFEVVGFVENLDRQRCLQRHGDLPIHWIDDIARFRDSHSVICCLSTTFRDGFIKAISEMGFRFATLVHPTATVSRKSTLGEGTSLNIGCIVAGYTQVGRYVQVNRGATIGHHTTIEDFVTIQPGVNLAGNCHIGSHTYIGIGATIVDGVRVGAHSIVGAGAVVTKDLPERVLALGVPARIEKEGIKGK